MPEFLDNTNGQGLHMYLRPLSNCDVLFELASHKYTTPEGNTSSLKKDPE